MKNSDFIEVYIEENKDNKMVQLYARGEFVLKAGKRYVFDIDGNFSSSLLVRSDSDFDIVTGRNEITLAPKVDVKTHKDKLIATAIFTF